MNRGVTRLDKDKKMREGCATRRITTDAKSWEDGDWPINSSTCGSLIMRHWQ
jgi:hypothetical protein